MTIATVLLVLMFGCLIYLTIDWIVQEIRRERRNRQELKDWNAYDDRHDK
jgi:hypothetical protein